MESSTRLARTSEERSANHPVIKRSIFRLLWRTREVVRKRPLAQKAHRLLLILYDEWIPLRTPFWFTVFCEPGTTCSSWRLACKSSCPRRKFIRLNIHHENSPCTRSPYNSPISSQRFPGEKRYRLWDTRSVASWFARSTRCHTIQPPFHASSHSAHHTKGRGSPD